MRYPLKSLLLITALSAIVFSAGLINFPLMILAAAAASSLFAAETLRDLYFRQRMRTVFAASIVTSELVLMSCTVWRNWHRDAVRLIQPDFVGFSFCSAISTGILAVMVAVVIGVLHHCCRGRL